VRIRKISRELLAKGHSVKLVYFPLDHNQAYKVVNDDSLEVISLDRRLGTFIFLKNISWLNKIAKWSEVIHFQKCYHYVALPALIASWVNKKALHYDWDDWETKIFYYSNPKVKIVGEFINIFEKLVPKLVDTISVSSEEIKKLCISKGVNQECIFHAPVGADLKQFNINTVTKGRIKNKYNINHKFVLYVGQLHGGQYAELFIKAARIVADIRRDVTFMIVGEGYRLMELKKLAEELNVHKYFIFAGGVSHKEIPHYIADADICVACFEDNEITRCKSPLKIAEYLAMNKAIVASNVGEVRKMVGGAGLLVEPGNKHSLAEGITKLIVDDNLRENLAKNSRYKSEKTYNWTITAETLLAAYQKALTKNIPAK